MGEGMMIRLFTFIDLFDRALATADHLLTKGVERAAELGVSEAEMLGWRLIGDMHPLAFQLMVVRNFSMLWPARVAGTDVPEAVPADLDVAGFRAAFAEARAFLAGLSEAQFEGRDDLPLTYEIMPGMAPTFSGGHWLSVFAMTNIHFHVTTAYGILRANGAKIGKPDMFASGL
jgi:hypothetical protein